MSHSDAYMFPVMGSGVLFGFYLLFKYFSKDYINLLLTLYFGIFGVVAVANATVSIAEYVLPADWTQKAFYTKKWESKKDGDKVEEEVSYLRFLLEFSVTKADIVGWSVALLLTLSYTLTKHWLLSNLMSLAFSHSAITLLHLDSFYTGFCLLGGLFFYDVFWVFGTDVMVSVAKNFDVPVKLLFPRHILSWAAWRLSFIWQKKVGEPSSAGSEFAMLGLGDIVIPGVFVALCLRFDEHLRKQRTTSGTGNNAYFWACYASYLAGLTLTIIVMHVFKAAQPALLYLSPACSLSALAVALAKGQLKELFAFSTEEKPQTSPVIQAANFTSSEPEKASSESVVESVTSGDELLTVDSTESKGKRKNLSRTSSNSSLSTKSKRSTAPAK